MIRKGEVLAKLARTNEQRRVAFMNTIDEALAGFDGERAARVPVPSGLPDHVVVGVMNDYRTKGGWEVARDKGDDQRDGAWDVLVLS